MLRAGRGGRRDLLASTDVIGIERAAGLTGALLGAPVSTGFVSRCLARLDAALTGAGFEDALKGALKRADVLGTDETPAPLTRAAASAEDCGNPHVYTVRTMNAYTSGGPDLIWYGAAGNRTKASITGFGILDGYRGVLVRDDYGGYLSYDAGLAGVQQCLAHLYRYLDDAYALTRYPRPGPAGRRGAARGRRRGQGRPRRRPGQPRPGPAGRAAPPLRPGRRLRDLGQPVPALAQGRPPRLVLARRLKRKAAQVWLFATRFDVPATNNGSENAIRGYKLAAKISGCWRTLATLQRHCRVRSYLATARSHAATPSPPSATPSTATWMPPHSVIN